ncbi:DNA-binding Lrp family transcriptional regulator [Rhodoligotrophos appendicifer]|uniref:Lrp/AsnC family transcriptional regulator n=1 Tax=Rhodoligotrophos appendicifer TaxID=987056 RepID=UPI001184D10E|nr:Lrp/AsnC family transcriptional regulator [Rhodoligotrophos appendicifer]
MGRKGKLDKVDLRILLELQDDGRMTNIELAGRVGISAPPCLRRVRALEEAGYITGYRAILSAEALGFEVTMFAMVGLHSQAEADLQAFGDTVAASEIVRESYMVSGESDFLLKCVAPHVQDIQAFVGDLTALPNVASVKTRLVLGVTKYEPGVPITKA